jgi:uncharacterized protein involved in outer membrane biogenesis
MTVPGSPSTRRSTKWLLWATGLLLAAAGVLILLLATRDAAVYRRALERQLSTALGRAVAVGSVSIDFSLPPNLSARDLRIANPAWASRPDLVSAASGEVQVDLVALWHGRVELRALHLQGVDLLLERNADGVGNWVFGAADRAKSSSAVPDFDAVSLTDARIAWRHSDGSTLQVQVASAEATIRNGAPFALQGQVSYAQTPLRLSVKADTSLQAALNAKALHVAIVVEPKNASLTLDARLASLDSVEGAAIGFELKGERLDAWSALLGQALPGWGPYRLAGQASYAGTSLKVEGLHLLLEGLPMQPSRLEIDSGTALLGADADTRFTAEGKLGGTAFSLDAGSSPWPKLRWAGAALPLKLRAVLPQFTLSAEGSIGRAASVPNFDLALSVQGDAMELARVFSGVRSLRRLPMELSARLLHAHDGNYSARNLRGRVLGTQVIGDLAFANGPRALLSGTLSLDRLNLAQPELQGLRTDEARDAGAAARPAAQVSSWRGRFESDLSLRIATIVGLPMTARDVAARVQWRDGVFGLQGVAATLADIPVTGEGTLRWTAGRPQVDGTLRIARLDLAKLGTGGAQTSGGSAWDAVLPLAALRSSDADLRIELGQVAGAPVSIGQVAAHARLQRGKLAVDAASATVADVPLQGQATLDASSNAWRIEANAKAERVDVAALLRALRQPAAASGVIPDLKLQVATQGTSARALLAQANAALRSAPFALALGRDRAPAAVQRASIEVEPGGPVRTSVTADALGAPLDLSVVGGPLAELLDIDTAWPKVVADLRSIWGQEAVHVNASSGPLQRLLGLHDVPLSLQATMPGAQATLQGTVANLAVPLATPLAGRIEIADLAHTAKPFTTLLLPAIPVTAAGRVTLGDGEVSIEALSAQAGRSDASGQLHIRWQGRTQLSVQLSSRLIDATQWAIPVVNEISVLDRPLPVEALLAQDVQLRLQAERLILSAYDLARLQFDGTLTNGLVEFSAAAAEGDLRGQLRFDLRREVPAVALRLALKEVEAQTLYTAAAGPTGAASPRLSISAQLAGAGATLRDMLAAGQGDLLLSAGAGELPIGAAHGLERIAGNLLTVLLPGQRTGSYAQLECAAARFDIANGIATSSDGIALRLKQLDILGGGAANLKTGEIQFGYRAVRRELFSLSLLGLTSGFAKVTGTIGNPTVGLDPGGLLIQGGAAWATAGLSLLAGELWRKLESTSDPCARITSGARTMADPLEALIHGLPPLQRLLPAAARP